ncbi:MAG: hypothetical protein QOF52_3117 [Propionibacteriaceae bacterium]|jgi:hypothetical protein|nr:hypothetical protein [Propionibacteriaceae bacterium]MDX6323259.1 hypothetical protein [Propionibacteriaceae bacterium]
MRKRITLVLIGVLIGVSFIVLVRQPASAATTTLNPVADSYVQADLATSNFGTTTAVKVDGSPATVSYLKFDVQSTETPTKATLKVFTPTSSTTPINVRSVADTAWGETTINYNNKPATGASAIASPVPIAANSTLSFDVTNLVTGNGLVSFAVDTTSSTSKSLPSRESTTNKPELVLETGTAPPPTTPPPTGNPGEPIADSYVQSDLPGSNFGTASAVKVDGSPDTVSYLKFDVTGMTQGKKATLKLFTPIASSTPINVRPVADTTWAETGLTYTNRPTPGTEVVASSSFTANSTISIDVTSLVPGNGVVSFAVDTTSGTSKSLPSKENATVANRPKLVIEDGTAPPPTTPPPTTPPPTSGSTTIAVGGDVACSTTEANYNGGLGTATACHMKQTSDLVLAMAPTRVWATGDLQYNSGSLADFDVSYENSWGRFRNITDPVVGNHEYGTTGAGGYYTYFGNAASPQEPGCTKSCLGYYSFDVPVGSSKWHVAVINSECTRIGGGVGCAVDSPQYNWLQADLRANAGTTCTAVLTHRPRWSSNSFASPDIQPLVDVMDANNVDLLLTGHAHSYERFAPQNKDAQADPNGIREIIVGTGGRDSQGFGTVSPNSLVRKNQTFGVMKLVLKPTGYDWSFVPDPSTPFADSGSGTCS